MNYNKSLVFTKANVLTPKTKSRLRSIPELGFIGNVSSFRANDLIFFSHFSQKRAHACRPVRLLEGLIIIASGKDNNALTAE